MYGRTGARPLQIFAPRRTEDLAVVINQRTAEKRAFHAPAKLDALKRRVTLMGFRLRRTHHKTRTRIDQNDIGIVAGRDIALAEQAETPRGIEAQQFGYVVVRHASFAAFTQ